MHRQREGEGHDDDHEDAGDPRGALQQVRVRRLPEVEVGPQQGQELVIRVGDQPWEVAGDVGERVDRRPDRDGARENLTYIVITVRVTQIQMKQLLLRYSAEGRAESALFRLVGRLPCGS